MGSTRSGRSRRPGRAGRTTRPGRAGRWTAGIAVGVLVCAAAGVGAAALLGDDSSPTATRVSAGRSVTPPTGSTPPVTTTGARCRSPLTPDGPLRIWIAGDSLAWSVGNALGRRAASTGVVAPVYDSRVSSGLASPGFFDWPRHAARELPRLAPEVVVFVMGTNDWQVPQAVAGTRGGASWQDAYRDQVRVMADLLAADGRRLIWLGPPVLRDGQQEAGAREVAAVIRDVVERTPHATYIDAHNLLDGDTGEYSSTIERDGRRLQVRAGDGIHLTPEGGDLLGDAVFAAIDDDCRIKAQAVPGARQPLVETRGSTSVPPAAASPSPAPTTASPAPTATPAPTSSATTSATTPTPPTTTPTPPTTGPAPTSPTSPPAPTATTLPGKTAGT